MPEEAPIPGVDPRHWNADAVAYLRRYAGLRSPQEIGKVIHKTVKAVRRKAEKLKISLRRNETHHHRKTEPGQRIC